MTGQNYSNELRFEIEWLNVAGVTAPELSSTWCRLSIWVGEQCVTLVEDIDTKSLRHSIYCSAYPLAEWIAYSWWFLHAGSRRAVEFPVEDRVQVGQSVSEWLGWHDMRSSGDGFFWPKLTIEPDGSDIAIRWEPSVSTTQPVAFRSNGFGLTSGSKTSAELSRFVNSVVERLEETGIAGTALQSEWSAISGLDSEQREYCLASARLGIDPFDAPDGAEEAILSAGEELPEEIVDDFLDAVPLEQIEDGLNWVRVGSEAVGGASGSTLPTDRLPKLLDGRIAEQLPWEVGYRQAKQIRTLFTADPAECIQDLGISLVNHRRVEDSDLVAIGGESHSGGFAVALDESITSSVGSRFVQARALWFAAHPGLKHRFLITNLAGNQRVARAFAAELLAPAAGIRAMVKNPRALADDSKIERIADHFGVSDTLVRLQVKNQILRGQPIGY